MSYNGYGMDNSFGAYAGQDEPSYLGSAYGAAYGEALLTTDYADTYRADALEFQRLLEAAGFGSQLGRKGADGYFGSNSSAATRAYQASVGLPQTGNADQATWDALRRPQPTARASSSGRVTGADILDTVGDVASSIFQSSGSASAPQTPSWMANIFGSSPAPASVAAPAAPPPANNTWKWVVGGVAVVAVLGGITYAATRKK